jgi:SAM-dependent methyltransferase
MGEQGAVSLSTADFDALYQGQAVNIGLNARMDCIPWQLDGPQPAVVELAESGQIVGPVLECGCGLGDNALYLAERGYQVTAFDAAATAIKRDQAKAAERGLPVNFVVADATTLTGIEGEFRTVVESAMMHCLDTVARHDYLAALWRLCRPGTRLHILTFTDAAGGAFTLPAPLDEASLRDLFSDGWRIERMVRGHYTTALTPAALRGMFTSAGKELTSARESFGELDDRGRVLVPMWQITAERV